MHTHGDNAEQGARDSTMGATSVLAGFTVIPFPQTQDASLLAKHFFPLMGLRRKTLGQEHGASQC